MEKTLPGKGTGQGTGYRRNFILKLVSMAAVIVVGLLVCYGGTLNCSWQYDDFSNILENKNTKMTALEWSQIKQAFYDQHPDSKLSRPLARLSFALNYYAGGFKVQGYHLVNITVHFINTFLLWLLVTGTINISPVLVHYRRRAIEIGWLAALFWGTHPIQVTAVTYIVQRMASMAAMFYLAAMALFLKAHNSTRAGKLAALAGCGICGLAACASKENAFMLPVTLLLFNIVFFPRERPALIKLIGVWGGFILLATAVVALLMVDWGEIAGPWQNRPFTLGQRLLTQPRVIWQYLGLLALPTSNRLSLLHDVQVSTGLFAPLTTIVAIMSMAVVLAGLIVLCRKAPLVGFSGLFFFLNHLIEGSVFNLELFYEHRNYLPSTWLFVPLALGLLSATGYFAYKKWLQWSVGACCAVLLISQIHVTWMYNRVFKSELSAWMDVVRKSPNLSLPHNNLGKVLWNAGLYQKAYEHFCKARDLDRYNDLRQKSLVYYNLGLYSMEVSGNYSEADNLFSLALGWSPGLKQAWYQRAQVWLLMGRPQKAELIVNKALKFWPYDCRLRSRQLLALCKQPNKEARAGALAGMLLADCPNDPVPAACLADLKQRRGDYRSALEQWERLEKMPGQKPYALLGQLEVFCISGRQKRVQEVLKALLADMDCNEFSAWLDELFVNRPVLPHLPDRELIMGVLDKSVCSGDKDH